MSSSWKNLSHLTALHYFPNYNFINHDSLQKYQSQNSTLTMFCPSVRYERNLSFLRKMSLFTALKRRRGKGSITVETAAVLPLFLFFLLAFFVFFQALHVQEHFADRLTDTARTMAAKCYAAEEGAEALGTLFSTVTALSFLVFTLLYTPCVAAISAVKRELGSGWKAAGVALSQCAVAWVVSFLVYHAVLLLV